MSNLHHYKTEYNTMWYALCIWEINCKLSICCRHWEICGISGRYNLWIWVHWLCLYALYKNWEFCIPQWWWIKYSPCPWGFLLFSSGTLSCDFWSFVTNHKFVSFLEVFCLSDCSTHDKNVLWTLLAKKGTCLLVAKDGLAECSQAYIL